MLKPRLPSRSEAAERGVSEEQIEELRAILAVFRFRLNADTLLDVSLIKALLDGPNAGRSSRFGFATRCRQQPLMIKYQGCANACAGPPSKEHAPRMRITRQRYRLR